MSFDLYEQNSTATLIIFFVLGAFLVFYGVYSFFAGYHAIKFGFHGDKFTWPVLTLFLIGSGVLIATTIVGLLN